MKPAGILRFGIIVAATQMEASIAEADQRHHLVPNLGHHISTGIRPVIALLHKAVPLRVLLLVDQAYPLHDPKNCRRELPEAQIISVGNYRAI